MRLNHPERGCHLRSGWFDSTEPSASTSLQGKQGVQGASALVRGGSSTWNLIEPSRTTSALRKQGVESFVTGIRGGSTVPNLLHLHRYRGNKVR